MFLLIYVPPQCHKWGGGTTPQQIFRQRSERNYFVPLTEKNHGSALDCHALNFSPGQIKPTTAHYARLDQIQMLPNPQAKQLDHFGPSGGWWPLPTVRHWPSLFRKDGTGLM